MGVLSGNTKRKSFKLHRKSGAASRLRSAISDKLHHFLSDYSDTVLAEYILVLVCNGKDQYQTRDDLEAFLGHRSSQFVSWLWDHLLKHDYDTTEIEHASDVYNDQSNNPSPSEVNINTNLSPPTLPNKLSSTVVLPDDTQRPIHKIVSTSADNDLLHLPKTDPISANSQSSASEYSLSKEIAPSKCNVLRTNLSPMLYQQRAKPRVSVWDRLGKPLSSRSNTAQAQSVHATKQHEQLLNDHMLMLTQCNAEATSNNTFGVPGLGNSCDMIMNNLSSCRKMKRDVSTTHKSHNIGRKRHLSEIATGPATSSVSLVGENNVHFQHKRNSQEFQKCKDPKTTSLPVQRSLTGGKCSITANIKPVNEEVVAVKQRLHQIEIEMSKLRSKQAQKEKGVKCNASLHSGPIKHPEEDVELRTVLVTNVHFAATKETLLLYFAKCGVVVHVIIFTDKATAPPKRSAYVTFASKESADNAVALSGASLLSRTIKVVKKSEAIAATTSAQFVPILCQASLSYHDRKAISGRRFYSGSHLQWRRHSRPTPSERSVPFCVEVKRSDSSTNQQLPGSTLPVKTTEANSLTEPSEAA